MLVGNAFNENLKKQDNSISTNFLAVSNNLIFLNSGDANNIGGQFSSGLRQVSKNNFSSQAITIDNSQNLQLEPVGGAKSLSLEANRILLNQNFRLRSGLAFDVRSVNQISNRTIYVDKVLASGLQNLTADNPLQISNSTVLNIPATAGAVTADKITFGAKDLCVVKTWTVVDNTLKQGVGVADSPIITADCPPNYFVFDLDASAGKMVCCQAASGQLQLSQIQQTP